MQEEMMNAVQGAVKDADVFLVVVNVYSRLEKEKKDGNDDDDDDKDVPQRVTWDFSRKQ